MVQINVVLRKHNMSEYWPGKGLSKGDSVTLNNNIANSEKSFEFTKTAKHPIQYI